MKKLLKFYRDLGKFDNKICTLVSGEDLEIELQVDTGRTVDYFATIINEKGIKRYFKANKKILTIPAEFLVFGTINITVIAQVGNEIVKQYNVEPLLIKEVNGGTQVVPEIEDLKQCVESLRKGMEDYKKEVVSLLDKFDKVLKSALMGE